LPTASSALNDLVREMLEDEAYRFPGASTPDTTEATAEPDQPGRNTEPSSAASHTPEAQVQSAPETAQRTETKRINATGSPALVDLVDDLKPLGVTCPYADSVALAVDDAGRLHLLIDAQQHDTPAGATATLMLVERWAADHRALLNAIADRPLTETAPVAHLFTAEPPAFHRLAALGELGGALSTAAHAVRLGRPLLAVPGNHDLDFDAGTDADSFDTFRRQWGAPYYSFDIGAVHFVVLDNVRYPCNGVDPFEGCGTDDAPTYSGVISDDQLDWLANDLAHVPREKLIVLNQHIPLQSFTNAAQQRGQTANLGALAALLEGRKVVAFSAHTHTVENIAPGESFAGWRKATGIAASPFHRQHIVGAVSGSWFTGNLDDAGIPEAYQRLGAPPGVMEVSFSGTNHAETYVALGTAADARLHAAPNTPRFRDWARAVIAHNNRGAPPFETVPPVALADYADPGLITRADLRGGSWIAVNVWNGGADTLVSFRIGDRPAVDAVRSQEGAGEAVRRGPAFADPFAFVRQASDGRVAAVSETDARGYRAFRGRIFAGYPGAPPNWLLGRSSSHLWFADLPPDLPAGLHRVTITATDRHGREVTGTLTIEVVEAMPPMEWQPDLWD